MITSVSAAALEGTLGKAQAAHKAHFVFLDGLRGIAALSVGWLHASQIFALGYSPFHAFLAVDFFFCLSGFVLAYAYDSKLAEGMTFADFAVTRLIRLYPMILAGIVIGALVSWFEASGGDGDTARLLALTASSLLLIPLGLAFGDEAYPINNPIWTLFFELAGSLLYGFERRFLRLKGIIPPAALLVTAVVLVFAAHRQHTLEVLGYSNPKMFVGGFIRLAFPLLAGVLIYRYGLHRWKVGLPSLPLAAALFLILGAPVFHISWIYDSVAVVILFPALIVLGATASDSGRLSRVWKLFGRLSYPFYLVHQPIIRGVQRLREIAHFPPAADDALVPVSLVLAIGCAYAATTLYDEPVRRRLSSLRPRPRLAPPLGAPTGP